MRWQVPPQSTRGHHAHAYEYKNKNYTDAKTLLRNQLDQELFVGVEELHGIGKTTVGGRPFYYYETRGESTSTSCSPVK